MNVSVTSFIRLPESEVGPNQLSFTFPIEFRCHVNVGIRRECLGRRLRRGRMQMKFDRKSTNHSNRMKLGVQVVPDVLNSVSFDSFRNS